MVPLTYVAAYVAAYVEAYVAGESWIPRYICSPRYIRQSHHIVISCSLKIWCPANKFPGNLLARPVYHQNSSRPAFQSSIKTQQWLKIASNSTPEAHNYTKCHVSTSSTRWEGSRGLVLTSIFDIFGRSEQDEFSKYQNLKTLANNFPRKLLPKLLGGKLPTWQLINFLEID